MRTIQDAVLVASHDLKHAIRTPRAVLFLFVYAAVSLVAGAIMVWVASQIESQVNAQLATLAGGAPTTDLADMSLMYKQLMTLLVGNEEKAAYLAAIPMIVLFFFWGTRSFLPWLIVLMGYDQINSEVHNRSVRYVLLRTERSSLVLGKIASLLVLLIALTVITNLVVLAFAALMTPNLDMASASLHLVRFWLLTLPLGLCWIALMSLLSALFRTPYVSLLVGVAALIGTAVLGWVAKMVESLSLLRWLVPWHYSSYLLSHRVSEQLFGVLAFLCFALVFSTLSYLVLRYRDV